MTISFQSKEEFFTFHDPMQEGKLTDRKTEIRFDPLTGETSRIIFDPGGSFTPASYDELAKQTEGAKCPFCPENVFSFTPVFPDELVEGGRLLKGEAVAFPNLFPYSKHNAVVRMCDQHYVKLDEFTPEIMENAFSAAHSYIQTVAQADPDTAYASINWNYLPPSGGSIIHPHIHVLASEHPTNYQRINSESAQIFSERTNENYYAALIKTEREKEERWIGEVGTISWVHAYAPKNHLDFIGVFEASSLDELQTSDWQHLADSLQRFFRYFGQIGIASFNAALFIPMTGNESDRVHIRIVPRMTIGMLDTSDMNVFNYLHEEPLSLKVPEVSAKEAAAHFPAD